MLFSDKQFKFQSDVCNGCNDILMSMNLTDVAVLNIHGAGYCCIITRINKSAASNFLQEANLEEKSGTL